MKNQITSFDLFCIVKEIEGFSPTYLEKIYTAEDRGIIFRFSASKDFELHLSRGFLSFPASPTQQPDSFTMELRKHIQGKRIDKISQLGFDRILKIEMGEYSVFIELFGEGNVVLTKNQKILAAKEYKKYGQREISRGADYRPPPPKPFILDMNEEMFGELCRKAKYDVHRNLVSQFWLGGIAEEILLRAGIEGSIEMRELTAEQRGALVLAVREIFEETAKMEPQIVFEGEKAIDVTPISLRVYEHHTKKNFEHFLEALREYIFEMKKAEKEVEFEREKQEKIEKARRKLEVQQEELKRAEEEYLRWEKIGNFIYENYDLLQSVLDGKAVADFIAKKENNKVECKLGDINFEIECNLSLNQNAQNAYATAAQHRARARKLREAIEQTRKEIEEIASREFVSRPLVLPKRRKNFWFETYRWFISSDGFIVVSGYDAESNDRVVKKYLKEKDRYVHADIHGSPSTVIKAEGKEIPESTIYEACLFTVCYSRAWAHGLGHLDAYWVKPEQVSKTPESGEFVAKGAWIIRGKKNFVTNLKLELAIGWIEYRGEKLLMCGPRQALEKHAKDFLILEPGGDEEKEAVAKKLANFFGVGIEVLQKLLPAGKTKVREKG